MNDTASNAHNCQNEPSPLPGSPITLLARRQRGVPGRVWLAQNLVGTFRAVKVVYRKTFQKEHHYEREFLGI